MKTENKNKGERLAYFKALYESARSAYSDTLSSLDKYMRQYQGSHEIDGGTDALTVRNITYEMVESQVSSEIPMPKADPDSYSELRDREAVVIESLCRSLLNKLPFDEMNDLDERFTYIYGGSVWLVEWDNECEKPNERGEVKIRVISPKNFIPQPGVFSVDDMEYCFIKFISTKSELMSRYGIGDEECVNLDIDTEGAVFSGEATVSVVLCFYRDENSDIGKFVFSGDVTLLDVEKYYKRKTKVCEYCGLPIDFCSCENKGKTKLKDVDFEFITEKNGGGHLKAPYYTPKSFPLVIRKNTSAENSLLGQSDCEYIRPEQQAINKIESRILQKLLRAAVTPIVPEDATIALNNSIFGQVIKMKPGESMAQYGKVDTTPDISQDITEAERLYDHSKRILGISDAFQGIDTRSGESGYAKQLRISQASGRLESKKKMKHTAYAKLYRIIFEHYLAFADEPRTLSYKDDFGRIHDQYFNRLDFLLFDPERSEFFYDDGFLFSVDENGREGYQREIIWEKNLENLKSGTLGDPTSSATLLRYWQSQERAHYPYARENVEYFRELMKGGAYTYGESCETV